jgi:ABC-type multidrug transport system ATPase subunit
MKIVTEKLEKKFRKEWIYTDFSFVFEQGQSYALTGPNGSGKSTLLKILSFYSLPTKGSISLFNHNELIKEEKTFQYISFAAPYVQLIEEFTLQELLEFSVKSKYITPISLSDFEDYIDLKTNSSKLISNYSSGMRQKIKLGLSLISHRPILLLDEPCTNLDRKAKDWFFEKLKLQKEKLIIIASNEKEEIDFCEKSISILDFKKS